MIKIFGNPQTADSHPTDQLLLPTLIGNGSSKGANQRGVNKSTLKNIGIVAAFVVLGAGLFVGGFFAGQGTRDSASEVKQKLAVQATRDHQQASAALQAQSTRLHKQARDAADAARSAGYASGEDAGYSSGVSDGTTEGYSTGYGDGNLDGYGQGFDEGTCYDPYTYAYVC